jgi:glycerol-3-phosphate cytidylyltransferase
MTKVITYGTFDLFHQGHYNLLKNAKALGDYLIVGVTTEHFDEARGKVNVVDSIIERIENVKQTGFADMIVVEDHDGQKIEDIQRYGVDIFTVGSDWVGTFDYLNAFCRVVYLDRTPNISSTILRKNKFPIVRIGIVGTGRIAPRFMMEARYVSGMTVECAYNPVTDSAKKFEKEHEVTVYNHDFDKFLDRVDAVYIASPHETHYEYAREALEKGKHVLCEKPLSFTMEESVEMYRLARSKDRVLMEAVKAAYCPGFQQLINTAMSGKIGEIRDVEACFSRIANVKSREMTDGVYGGAFMEYGSNALLPIIKLMGPDYQDVTIDSILDERGIDMYTKIQLRYRTGLATAKTGVGVKSEGQLVVAGTKGYILAPSPWWLMKQFDVRYEDEAVIEHYEPSFQGDGLRYEISEFISKINGSGTRDYKLTAEESIAISGIVEKFMKQRHLV